MARDFATVKPQFWIGKTGRAITRAGKDARIVAAYLVTGPASNLIGLYYLPVPSISHETGLDPDAVLAALEALSILEFAHYDREAEVVWVVSMARFQMGWKGDRLAASDKRVSAAQREYREVADNAFLAAFFARYHVALHLTEPRRAPAAEGGPLQAPSMPLASPLHAPPKGLQKLSPDQDQDQNQNQDQDHEQNQNHEASTPAAPDFAHLTTAPADDGNYRVVLAVASGLLTEERFTDQSELVDRTKAECAKLRIDYGDQVASDVVHRAVSAAWVAASLGLDQPAATKRGRRMRSEHYRHPHCGRVCITATLFDEFVRRRGHERAADEIRNWARGVELDWKTVEGDLGDASKFWRARFNERWPTSAARTDGTSGKGATH